VGKAGRVLAVRSRGKEGGLSILHPTALVKAGPASSGASAELRYSGNPLLAHGGSPPYKLFTPIKS